MTISIHNLKPAKNSTKKRKRIGRGNASGKGTYSGKGLKGQKSRSGVSNLKRLGMKQVLLRTPKKRGFKSKKPKAQVVNLREINLHFKDKETVEPKSLLQKGLIDNIEREVKILGTGNLTVKNLNLVGVKISDSAKEQVLKAKGTVK